MLRNTALPTGNVAALLLQMTFFQGSYFIVECLILELVYYRLLV